MSTHCTISLKNDDGTVEMIYVHKDGYPSWIAPILLEQYNSREAVEELISLGDASVIYPTLKPDPNKVHSYTDPQKEVSVFYYRDRGEKWSDVKARKCSYEMMPEAGSQSYNYIYCNGEWYMWERDKWYARSDEERLIPLASLYGVA